MSRSTGWDFSLLTQTIPWLTSSILEVFLRKKKAKFGFLRQRQMGGGREGEEQGKIRWQLLNPDPPHHMSKTPFPWTPVFQLLREKLHFHKKKIPFVLIPREKKNQFKALNFKRWSLGGGKAQVGLKIGKVGSPNPQRSENSRKRTKVPTKQ